MHASHKVTFLSLKPVQGSTRRTLGLVHFIPALSYHFCLNLPAAFTLPEARLLVEPCTKSIEMNLFFQTPTTTPEGERKRTAEMASLSGRLRNVEAKVARVDRRLTTHDAMMGAMRVRADITGRQVTRLGEEVEDTTRQRSKDCLVMSGQGNRGICLF